MKSLPLNCQQVICIAGRLFRVMTIIEQGTLRLLRHESEEHPVGFGLVRSSVEDHEPALLVLLSEEEHSRYTAFNVEKRQLSYLLGRSSAKLALLQLFPESHPEQITIRAGVFGFPVVESLNVRVCISHCDNIGLTFAHSVLHPIGVDIERLREGKEQVFNGKHTDRERSLLKGKGFNSNTGIFLWTIKEALSKVILTGTTLDFKLMEIRSAELLDNGTWECYFSYFIQYKAISLLLNDYIVSIVLPYKSQLRESDLEQLRSALSRI